MQELLEEELEEIEQSDQALQEMLSRAHLVMDKITEVDFDN